MNGSLKTCKDLSNKTLSVFSNITGRNIISTTVTICVRGTGGVTVGTDTGARVTASSKGRVDDAGAGAITTSHKIPDGCTSLNNWRGCKYNYMRMG